MVRFLSLFIALVSLGCMDNSGYFNYDKWKVHGTYDDGWMRGKPKEVEAVFFDVKDTTLYGEGEKQSEELFRFDDAGNIVFRSNSFGTLLYAEIILQYDENGEQYHMQTFKNKQKDSLVGEVRTTSTKIKESKYLINHFRDNEKRYEEHHTYLPGKVIKERTFPDGDKIISEFWYKGNKLVKATDQTDETISTAMLYWNSNKSLDSIVYSSRLINSSKEYVSKREVFISNEQGDTILYYEIEGKDTTSFQRNSYVYDKQGNWIRQLNYRNTNPIINKKFPYHNLIIREIKY